MCESQYSDLLNRLVEMQSSPYYATARLHLIQAETTIIYLENKVKELECKLNHQAFN